jgi:S1-C subfamily serine protease
VVSILVKGEVSVPGFPIFSQEIEGGGSGFIISSDGMILTNKHVVQYNNVEYTVILQNKEEYSAEVLARDPVQDLAILKIEKTGLQPLTLGNSDNLKIGQTVIAIGNALGEFQNTVSVGVVSGLSRRITATGGGMVETLEEVIQTDAAINSGNSGGPLLNLSGEVIGINTAVASNAENIGFAIPVNKAKKAIEDVKSKGRITYPFLGVRYVLIDETVKAQYNLPVDYGAWVVRGSEIGEVAVTPGSGADKAGIKENDIILEADGKKITTENTLSKVILSYNIGDKIKLKILREGKEIEVEAELGEQ